MTENEEIKKKTRIKKEKGKQEKSINAGTRLYLNCHLLLK